MGGCSESSDRVKEMIFLTRFSLSLSRYSTIRRAWSSRLVVEPITRYNNFDTIYARTLFSGEIFNTKNLHYDILHEIVTFIRFLRGKLESLTRFLIEIFILRRFSHGLFTWKVKLPIFTRKRTLSR